MRKENFLLHNLKALAYDPNKELPLLFSKSFESFNNLRNLALS